MTNTMKYKIIDFKSFDKGVAVDENPNVVSVGHAENSYNFSYLNGGLTDGMGIGHIRYYKDGDNTLSTWVFPETLSPLKVSQFPFYNDEMTDSDRMILFYCDNQRLYGWQPNSTSDTWTNFEWSIDSAPQVFNYMIDGAKYVFALTHNNIYIYKIDDGTLSVINEGVPKIESICFYNNRAFAVLADKRHSLWYSDQSNPANWVEAAGTHGYINFNDLKGNCLKVISYGDGVYLFREYGISKITYNAKEDNYDIENICTSTGKIFGCSIQECGENIVYMTTDGMYSFNGTSSKKLTTRIEKLLRQSVGPNTITAYHNGNYYLALNISFNDGKTIGCESGEYTNNTLIQINLDSLTESILRGVDVVELKNINEVNSSFLFVVIKGEESNKLGIIDDSGKVFTSNLQKYWKSTTSDFSLPDKKKILRRFFIVTKGDIQLKLSSETKSCVFNLKGNENVQILKPNLTGYRFNVEISTSSDKQDVSNLKAMVGYYD